MLVVAIVLLYLTLGFGYYSSDASIDKTRSPISTSKNMVPGAQNIQLLTIL